MIPNKSFLKLCSRNISEEKLMLIIEDEVFNDADFKRQILETSIKLKIDIVVIDTVIKHYIKFAAKQCCKVTRIARRIKFYGFFHLDILEMREIYKLMIKKENDKLNK